MKKFIFACLATSCLLLPWPGEAAEVGLATTKNLFDISLLPGDSFSDSLTVYNLSGVELPVQLGLSLWNLKEFSDDIEFIEAEESINATTWFAFESGRSFSLSPGGDREVRFSLKPPPDAAPGSYFVMLRFQPEVPFEPSAENGPRFIPELGVLFFIRITSLTVEGTSVPYAGEIRAFNITGSQTNLARGLIPGVQAGVYENLVRSFSTKLANTGLYYFKAQGVIEITNLLGVVVARFNLPPRYLLPNRVREFLVDDTSRTLSWWQRNSHFGRYTARLTLAVPEATAPLVTEISFWVFPWQIVLVVLACSVAIVLFRHRLWLALRALVAWQTRGVPKKRK